MPLIKNDKSLVPLRGVHLDLKGCPPTSDRLQSLLPLISRAGYNAILVEWEDQFPWTVDARFRATTAYTTDEVRGFLETAHHLGIEVIPLVQSLGHMETPLSFPEYAQFREVPDRSDVLNPLAEGSRALVEKMIDDVLALMPSPIHFHLGGDEAWTFGTHPDTKAYIAEHGKGALYLHHIEPILDKLIAKNIRPILWHDMMISWDDAALKRLADRADLMVWGYSGKPLSNNQKHYSSDVFEKFTHAGIPIWGACAYKGADGQNVDLPNFANRETNAIGYAEVAEKFPLRGIIATAWSRYSTQRIECEPIDAALDSLVNVGAILHDGQSPGRDACLDFLKETGERPRFDACFAAMTKLTTARHDAWSAVQTAREIQAIITREPARHGAQADTNTIAALQRAVKSANTAADQSRKAFAGLLPDIAIERYLRNRIDPLEKELAELKTKNA